MLARQGVRPFDVAVRVGHNRDPARPQQPSQVAQYLGTEFVEHVEGENAVDAARDCRAVQGSIVLTLAMSCVHLDCIRRDARAEIQQRRIGQQVKAAQRRGSR